MGNRKNIAIASGQQITNKIHSRITAINVFMELAIDLPKSFCKSAANKLIAYTMFNHRFSVNGYPFLYSMAIKFERY